MSGELEHALKAIEDVSNHFFALNLEGRSVVYGRDAKEISTTLTRALGIIEEELLELSSQAAKLRDLEDEMNARDVSLKRLTEGLDS